MFYFYDLETTGFNSRGGRIMQFGGQRTTLDFRPIGKPDNLLIKITDDVLPDPSAILVTKITPQQTLANGISEADFTKYFSEKINKPGTIFVGFNSVRFDDEFMRHMFYRNFYDPYEWQWQDGNSRWDLLDVSRMTRALRPDGISWPFDASGAPSNQLNLLTSLNKLAHDNAHDALSDVMATIELAKLIKQKQPKLFSYLLKLRDKKSISALTHSGNNYIYTSGKYPSQYLKTTVVKTMADHPKRQAVIVYDLRQDPTPFMSLKLPELVAAWQRRDPTEGLILPVKTLQFNRCPAIAPISVLDKKSMKRLDLKLEQIARNTAKISDNPGFTDRVLQALEVLDKKQQSSLIQDERDVDNQLYEGFFDNRDKAAMHLVRAADPDELSQLASNFRDKRLQALLPLYKARNFNSALTLEERRVWDKYRYQKLTAGGDISPLARYFNQLEQLNKLPNITPEQKFMLEELRLYGESVLPS